MGGMTTLRISPHAKQRRKEMGVTEHRIELAMANPEMRYPSYGDRTCFQREAIVVVVQDSTGEIVTILFHKAEGRDENGGPL